MDKIVEENVWHSLYDMEYLSTNKLKIKKISLNVSYTTHILPKY